MGSAPSEFGRKLLHFASLALPGLIMLLGKQSLWILIPLCALSACGDMLRARSVRFAAFIRRTVGSLMRPSEIPSVPGKVIVNGATWVHLSSVTLVLLFPVHMAAAALAMHLVCDAIAALTGHVLGRHRWPRSTSTIEGSLAYMAVGTLILALWPGIVLWHGVAAAACATAAEAFPGRANDNLVAPGIAAMALAVLAAA